MGKTQAKALEEIGEYLTAETDEERMDAIGDIAVCIVNAARLSGEYLAFYESNLGYICTASLLVIKSDYKYAIRELVGLAIIKGYSFEACLEKTWNEIKGRKGMMADGKYVKWENLTEEQREEFKRRDHGNTLIRE